MSEDHRDPPDDVDPQIQELRQKHADLLLRQSPSPAIQIFEKSVERLDADSRASVLEGHTKLLDSFVTLREALQKILSTDQGRETFEREIKKRLGEK